MKVSEFNQALEAKMSRSLAASLDACVRCGLCAESCHYYVADPRPEYVPAVRAEAVRNLWRQETRLAKLFPWLYGIGKPREDEMEHLKDVVFGTCTMCNRCTLNCPVGVDTARIIRSARGVLSQAGYAPQGLRDTVDLHLQLGNNMGVSKEDFLDTVEWMEEQLQDDTGDPDARIPVDKQGAEFMFTMNPREIKYYPLSFLASAKIFYAAGVDWTVSSQSWDLTNYALFSGEDDNARRIAGMLADAATDLGVKTVVLGECGHGFRSFRWEAEEWLQRSLPFTVISFLELQAQWLKSGKIKVKKVAEGESVTYHDPCNQARNGGIVYEPRYILEQIVDDFREMNPHGEENYCCGGGGGMLAMSEYAPRRIAAGAAKARQVEAAGARVLVTSCHNCLDQLADINKHYQLNVRILNLSELLSGALLLENKDH